MSKQIVNKLYRSLTILMIILFSLILVVSTNKPVEQECTVKEITHSVNKSESIWI